MKKIEDISKTKTLSLADGLRSVTVSIHITTKGDIERLNPIVDKMAITATHETAEEMDAYEREISA